MAACKNHNEWAVSAICCRSWRSASRQASIIVAIPEAPVVERIFTHFGLQGRVTPWAQRQLNRAVDKLFDGGPDAQNR